MVTFTFILFVAISHLAVSQAGLCPIDKSLCKESPLAPECSGVGRCLCGQCQCKVRADPLQKIYGQFCQCNNFACDRYEDKVCGGADRGSCDCGTCKCKEGFIGTNCGQLDCKIAEKNCLSPDGSVCGGKGQCNCGECVCNRGYSGEQCQCNNLSCDRYRQQICGGADRGSCDCGTCKCKAGFLGTNCGQLDCKIAEKNCLSPDGNVCSGNGQCLCGDCDCNVGYSGKHCQNCVSCPSLCSSVKECVLCQAFNTGGAGCKECNLELKMVDQTEQMCQYVDARGCYWTYSVRKEDGRKTAVLVEKKKSRDKMYIIGRNICGTRAQ